MKAFGAMLKKFIDEQRLAVNYVSRLADINRGGMYNIFAGSRVLPEDRLPVLLESGLFTQKQKKMLREAYYTEIYGEEQMQKTLYIISALGRIANPNRITKSADAFEMTQESEAVVGKYSLMSAIRFVIKQEAMKGGGEVYTNFSYSDTDIDDTFFICISESADKVALSHILTFDSVNSSTKNLMNIFSSIRYLQCGSNPLCSFESVPLLQHRSEPYIYFAVSSSHYLCWDEGEMVGYITSEPGIVASMLFKLKQQKRELRPLAVYSDNEVDFKQIVSRMRLEEYYYSYSFMPCLAHFADRELMNTIAKDVPGREMLIELYLTHIRNLDYNTKAKKITCISGLKKFMSDGVLPDISGNYINPIPPELRKAYVEKYLDLIMQKGQQKICYIDEDQLTFPDGIYLDCSAEKMLHLGLMRNGQNGFCGEIFVEISDAGIIKDFYCFTEYVLRSGLILSARKAADGIRKALNEVYGNYAV